MQIIYHLNINDEAQKANSLESAKKTTQIPASKHIPHHSIIHGLKQALSIGANKAIFATLLRKILYKKSLNAKRVL